MPSFHLLSSPGKNIGHREDFISISIFTPFFFSSPHNYLPFFLGGGFGSHLGMIREVSSCLNIRVDFHGKGLGIWGKDFYQVQVLQLSLA